MNEQKKKPSAGIAFLGFLLTFLLTVALLMNGLLIGLKTTIFKGTDMVDVLKNANLFETFTELVVSEVSAKTNSDMMGDVAASVFSEDVMVGMAEEVTDAIKNETNVDLSHMKNTCMNEIKNVSEDVVNDVIAEIENGAGELNADTLANNKALREMQKQYGVDITGIVMDYVERNYGATSVNVEDIDMEEVRTQAKTTIDEVVMPAMEEVVDEYIVEMNQMVNEEIRTITKEYDISGTLTTIEKVISTLTLILIVVSILSVIFVLLQMVSYTKFLNRAFRNTGIAAVVSGSIVALVGSLVIVLKTFVVGLMGIADDKVGQVVIEFIDGNISTIGYRVLLIGGIYIIVAIACFVIAEIVKKRGLNNGY